MGKSKAGKTKGAVSAGIHSNVSKKVLNALRSDYMKSGQRLLNQRIAFDAGKNVMVTIENPNKNETNKRFIRVNARDVWRTNRDDRNKKPVNYTD
jgi:hypothetical protein